MTERRPWRSLQSVMVVTLHVAVVATIIRAFSRPGGSTDSVFVWVPVTIGVALFLSWPIGRAFASAFDPDELPFERKCPTCGRLDLRPLVRTGGGLFQPVTSYRCRACWTTFRRVGELKIEGQAHLPGEPVDPTGVEFLDELATDAEIRFVDKPSDSSS